MTDRNQEKKEDGAKISRRKLLNKAAMVSGSAALGAWIANPVMAASADQEVKDLVDQVKKLSLEDQHKFITEVAKILKSMADRYSCCIKEPCTYCLIKHPEHGKGTSCQCVDDVVSGRHPCGACMGEILEGEGINALGKYFAVALTDATGNKEHLPYFKQIIADIYGIPPDQQVVPAGWEPAGEEEEEEEGS